MTTTLPWILSCCSSSVSLSPPILMSRFLSLYNRPLNPMDDYMLKSLVMKALSLSVSQCFSSFLSSSDFFVFVLARKCKLSCTTIDPPYVSRQVLILYALLKTEEKRCPPHDKKEWQQPSPVLYPAVVIQPHYLFLWSCHISYTLTTHPSTLYMIICEKFGYESNQALRISVFSSFLYLCDLFSLCLSANASFSVLS